MLSGRNKILLDIYGRLYRHFGRQKWWPADSKFEVIIGAILTQNTSWSNVQRAIENLKKEKALSPEKLNRLTISRLGQIIKPSGFYNIKAKRIKAFLGFLYKDYKGSLTRMFNESLPVLREKLLAVNGIGPETADSILLYAAGKPVFVVDAYTKRIFSRHGFIKHDADYHQVQRFFSENLPGDTRLFNEYHALIVELGKNICKKAKPRCEQCPVYSVK